MLQAISEYGVGSLGRELSVQLAHRALKGLESEPFAAFLWATPEYNLSEAVNALRVLLGDVVVWGGTVRQVWNERGYPAHGMVLTVLGGDRARLQGWHFARQPSPAEFASVVESGADDGCLLAAVEAMQSRMPRWIDLLTQAKLPVVGGLVGGRLQVGRPTLVGGRAAGEGGAAVAALTGVRVGVGKGTGWRSSGLWTTVTDSRGEWVRALDDKPAAEALEAVFGQPSRQWSYAPLREFIRLYPLGLRRGTDDWDIRAPLHVEADGSLRMTLPVPRETRAYWMVGDVHDAVQQTETAVAEAMKALGDRAPVLAMVFIDWAWYYLLTSHEDVMFRRIRRLLGADVPMVGVYTYGQFFAPEMASPVRLLHNHVVVTLLASA